eukprot:INCI4366.1.p2 GENE.INCI4366.1~~INCI4366.1.p2  ORF type:complete len:270 (+),score=57.74 INCI4366.1:257-1066(+)
MNAGNAIDNIRHTPNTKVRKKEGIMKASLVCKDPTFREQNSSTLAPARPERVKTQQTKSAEFVHQQQQALCSFVQELANLSAKVGCRKGKREVETVPTRRTRCRARYKTRTASPSSQPRTLHAAIETSPTIEADEFPVQRMASLAISKPRDERLSTSNFSTPVGQATARSKLAPPVIKQSMKRSGGGGLSGPVGFSPAAARMLFSPNDDITDALLEAEGAFLQDENTDPEARSSDSEGATAALIAEFEGLENEDDEPNLFSKLYRESAW